MEESTGGTDIESDDSLAERIYIAPSKYSVAGPEESYRYWVKTFNSSITDVYIDSENPTEVLIEFIMNDGELPNESIIRSLQDYLQKDLQPSAILDIFIVDTNSLNRSLNNWVERFSWLTMKKKLQSLS